MARIVCLENGNRTIKYSYAVEYYAYLPLSIRSEIDQTSKCKAQYHEHLNGNRGWVLCSLALDLQQPFELTVKNKQQKTKQT